MIFLLKNIGRFILPIGLLILTLNSCILIDMFQKEDTAPKEISLPIKWSLPVRTGSGSKLLVIDNIAYRADPYEGIIAFSLETGDILWQITKGFYCANNLLLVNGYIVVIPKHSNEILLLNPGNGNIERRVQLTLDGETTYNTEVNQFVNSGYYIKSKGNSLYWGTYYGETEDNIPLGLVSIDLVEDIVLNSNNEYMGTINVLYENDLSYEEWINDDVYIEDGIIYFTSNALDWDNDWRPRYRAMDLNSKEVLWESIPEKLFAGGYFNFYDYGDALFLSDIRGFSLLNKSTGEFLYEVSPGSGYDAGGFIVDNLFYSTNSAFSESVIRRDNIQCVNMNTGKQVWGYLSGDESLGNRPVVYDGLLFVACQTDIMIFDAKNGKYLGYSEDAFGGINQFNHNIIYNDKYMILDGESKIFRIDLEEAAKRVRD